MPFPAEAYRRTSPSPTMAIAAAVAAVFVRRRSVQAVCLAVELPGG